MRDHEVFRGTRVKGNGEDECETREEVAFDNPVEKEERKHEAGRKTICGAR